MPYFIN